MTSIRQLLCETRLSISEFCAENGVSLATFWRWANKGSKGLYLETFHIGGRRYTTREAFERFVAARSLVKELASPRTPVTAKRREKQIAAAEAFIDKEGFSSFPAPERRIAQMALNTGYSPHVIRTAIWLRRLRRLRTKPTKRRVWNEAAVQLLRENYSQHGPLAVADLLGLSCDAVKHKASELRLRLSRHATVKKSATKWRAELRQFQQWSESLLGEKPHAAGHASRATIADP